MHRDETYMSCAGGCNHCHSWSLVYPHTLLMFCLWCGKYRHRHFTGPVLCRSLSSFSSVPFSIIYIASLSLLAVSLWYSRQCVRVKYSENRLVTSQSRCVQCFFEYPNFGSARPWTKLDNQLTKQVAYLYVSTEKINEFSLGNQPNIIENRNRI